MRSFTELLRSSATALALAALAAAQSRFEASSEALLGTWDGTCEPPGTVGGDPFSLIVEEVDGEVLRGVIQLTSGGAHFTGTFDAARGALVLATDPADGQVLEADLALRGDALAGQGHTGAMEWSFRVTRASREVLARSHLPREVDLGSAERPTTFSLVGLEDELGFQLDDLVTRFVEKNPVVGLSIACVVDGELVDVRSSGWEDFFAGVPASDETRYRWASISKPMTATAAMRLAARGALDLDTDVRTLVPEFPEKTFDGKPARITPRLVLCHQSGICHYEAARRTWREYDTPFPFEELANGLDIFRESPLLFAPGTQESYSTHAWTLLGLTMERAAKKRYADVVRELVLEPCGMKSTEPDYPSHAIPHRSAGYELAPDGRMLEIFDDDISWKLPGGGWISTVGDLARFGAGLMGSALLDDEQKRAMWSPQKLVDGTTARMGLGFELPMLGNERLVAHSGGQRKASTYLVLLPQRRLGVAVMSNSETTPSEVLARSALVLLRDAKR